MNCEGRNGQSCYVAGVRDALETNPDAMAKVNIHHMFNRVDSLDPCAVKQFAPKRPGGYPPKEQVFICFPTSADKNTPKMRQLQCESLCEFNNNPVIQKNYYRNTPGTINYNNIMTFDGDVTPQNPDDAPYLSDFLTIGDVMTVLGEYYKLGDQEQPTRPSDKQLVSDQKILDIWFAPKLHEKVKSLYGGDGSLAPGFNLPDRDL
jgi:hypothetical protein